MKKKTLLLQCYYNEVNRAKIYRHVGATYMDVAFPYKEAITNAYGPINHTTTNVANQSPLTVLEEKTKQRSVN